MNIAIIGGGLSGTLLSSYLLKHDASPMTIFLFEKDSKQLGRGIAYRESTDGQLLNVPAWKMNIYGQPEGSFYNWLCEKVKNEKPAKADFVERVWFGTYLKELLEQQVKQSKNVSLRVITDEVLDIVKDHDRVRLLTKDGHEYEVSYAILANGVLPPADPFHIHADIKQSGLYQSNPWSFRYIEKIKERDQITLIGTGLTMLDHAASLLRSNKNLKVTALSRRGFLPLPHAGYEDYAFPNFTIVPCEDIGTLYRSIRDYYESHKKFGLEWRCLVDRVRLQVRELWPALSDDSKKRFIRHLKPYWEIHRHRAPQKVLNLITEAKKEGRFQLLKGRVKKIELIDNSLLALTVGSAGKETVIASNYLVNTSGLQNNIRLTADPLLRNMLRRGHMHPDANALGVDVDAHGALFCSENKRNIFSLGVLRRSMELECTAAKEIGEQAFKLSKHLLDLSLTKTQ